MNRAPSVAETIEDSLRRWSHPARTFSRSSVVSMYIRALHQVTVRHALLCVTFLRIIRPRNATLSTARPLYDSRYNDIALRRTIRFNARAGALLEFGACLIRLLPQGPCKPLAALYRVRPRALRASMSFVSTRPPSASVVRTSSVAPLNNSLKLHRPREHSRLLRHRAECFACYSA